jgi:hypothetical protein
MLAGAAVLQRYAPNNTVTGRDTDPPDQSEGYIPPQAELIDPPDFDDGLEDLRVRILEQRDPNYDRYCQVIDSEGLAPPELIPQRTVLSKLGLHILGGNHVRTVLSDAQMLHAKSLLYLGSGSDETVLPSIASSNLVAGQNIPVITRFLTPDNMVRSHEDVLLNTIDAAKSNFCPGKSPQQIAAEGKRYIELINEPNLYTPTIEPEKIVDEFMYGARLAKAHGFKVLIPPMAPFTPYDADIFPYGDEMEYFARFLDAFKLHPDFDSLKEILELSVHGYAQHPGDNPLEHIAQVHTMATDRLGLPLPIHVTEYGLNRKFASSVNTVTRAIEVHRLLSYPLPDDLPIKTISFWTVYADPPEPNPENPDAPIEDYRVQSLRESDTDINLEYKAFLDTYQRRQRDIVRLMAYENRQRQVMY